ncbi:hypothetical protein K488DRAFT_91316 [Vararia minispora EC-137]|uniref:Uncharacterized protein n=1 Tax=Vararia minispora EC-137 TaxID=1314806 RepID=A0ACB8Q5Q1_9AGAM|nr:hypothetical protein K488DRAFT_91316 [Vararia minispora EC-137]
MAEWDTGPPLRPPKRNAALANLHPGKTHILDHQQKCRTLAQKKADDEEAAQESTTKEKKKRQKIIKTAKCVASIEDSVLKADREHANATQTAIEKAKREARTQKGRDSVRTGKGQVRHGQGEGTTKAGIIGSALTSKAATGLDISLSIKDSTVEDNQDNDMYSENGEDGEYGGSDEGDDAKGNVGGSLKPDSSDGKDGGDKGEDSGDEGEDGENKGEDKDKDKDKDENENKGEDKGENGEDKDCDSGKGEDGNSSEGKDGKGKEGEGENDEGENDISSSEEKGSGADNAESETLSSAEYMGGHSESESDTEEETLEVPKRRGLSCIKKTVSGEKDCTLQDAVCGRRTEVPTPAIAPNLKPVTRQVKRKAPESDNDSQPEKASRFAPKKAKGELVASGLRSDWLVTNHDKINNNAPLTQKKPRSPGSASIKSEPVPDPSLHVLFPNATVVDLTLDPSDDKEIKPSISDEDEVLTNAVAKAKVRRKSVKKEKHGTGVWITESMGIIVKKKNADAAVKLESELVEKVTLETHFPVPGSRAFKRFNAVYTLFALSWVGTVEHPFSVNEHNNINKTMQDMWNQVYPEHKTVRVTEHKILKSTLNSRFDTWRSEFGKRAIDALEYHFNERGLDTRDARKDYMQTSLQPSLSSSVPMLVFKDRENELGAFQDKIIIQPISALALAAAAVERAYTLFEKTGDNKRQKAEDKARCTQFSFNDLWAATVESYMKSIKMYSNRKWARILDEAQKLAPKVFRSVATNKTSVRDQTERGIIAESDGE